MEPCAEVRTPFEAIEVQKGVEQAVLDDVLRILFVASQAKGDVVHRSPMTLHELQEHVDIGIAHLTGSHPGSITHGMLPDPLVDWTPKNTRG
jgi:hypothetical protein